MMFDPMNEREARNLQAYESPIEVTFSCEGEIKGQMKLLMSDELIEYLVNAKNIHAERDYEEDRSYIYFD